MKKTIFGNALAKHSLTLFTGVMVASVLSYFFHLLIGRWVSVEAYGEIESLNSIINIIIVPAAAISLVATKYSAGFKAEDNPQKSRLLIRFVNRKMLWVVLPLFLLFLVLTPWIGRFLNFRSTWPIMLLGAYMALSLFSSVNNGTLNGWKKFKGTRDIGIAGAVVKLIVGAVLVKIGLSVTGAMAGYFFGGLVAYLISFRMLNFLGQGEINSSATKFEFSSIKNYAATIFWGSLALNILGNADMVLAKHNLEPLLAGQYGALTIVSKIIFFATSVIATVLFSVSAENHHRKEDSTKAFLNALFFIILISGSAILIYFLFPNLVLGVLFGAKYASVAGYLGWFGIVAGLFSLVNLVFQYLLSLQSAKSAYTFLAVALLFSATALFFGKTIHDILLITALSQAVALILGGYLVAKNKKTDGQEAYIYSSPGI